MKKTRNEGITLIALVITIIVLLILAGVSIAMLTGDNGILTQASNAKTQQEYSSVVEGIKLSVNEYITEKETGETTQSFIDWLKEAGREYINDANEIQIATLLGQELSTGKGSGTSDVYKIEEVTETAKLASNIKVAATTTEENKKYDIVYYDENGTRNVLNTFSINSTEPLEETDPSLFEIDDNGIISLKDYNDYYIGKKTWTIENVVIPSEVDGKKVKYIGSLFEMYDSWETPGFRNIKSIIIPEGVEGIQGYFRCCRGLEKVVLPSTIKYISRDAFDRCSNLTSIEIPDSVTSIGRGAFNSCTSLKSITIPSSVTEMGYDVFDGWTEDQTIYVPFNRGEEPPSGWNQNWYGGSSATIVYAND